MYLFPIISLQFLIIIPLFQLFLNQFPIPILILRLNQVLNLSLNLPSINNTITTAGKIIIMFIFINNCLFVGW